MLATRTHHSPPLARAWAAYGPTAFTWAVLEVVDNSGDLERIENEYIMRLRPAYNTRVIRKTSGKPKGMLRPPLVTNSRQTPVLRLRMAHRLTLRELSDRANLSIGTIRTAEQGCRISYASAEKLAAALETTVAALQIAPEDGD